MAPGAWLQRQLGNLYTASLYSGLAGLLHLQRSRLAGRRVLCFSFGSGATGLMFALRGRQTSLCVTNDTASSAPGQAWRQQQCTLEGIADMVGGGGGGVVGGVGGGVGGGAGGGVSAVSSLLFHKTHSMHEGSC